MTGFHLRWFVNDLVKEIDDRVIRMRDDVVKRFQNQFTNANFWEIFEHINHNFK